MNLKNFIMQWKGNAHSEISQSTGGVLSWPLEQSLLIGGTTSIAVLSIIGQTHSILKLWIREILNRVWPTKTLYTKQYIKDQTSALQKSNMKTYLIRDGIGGLFIVNDNVYYLQASQMILHSAVPLISDSDAYYKIHPYFMFMYTKALHMTTIHNSQATNFIPMLQNLLYDCMLHMILNDIALLFKNCKTYPNLANVKQTCKSLVSAVLKSNDVKQNIDQGIKERAWKSFTGLFTAANSNSDLLSMQYQKHSPSSYEILRTWSINNRLNEFIDILNGMSQSHGIASPHQFFYINAKYEQILAQNNEIDGISFRMPHICPQFPFDICIQNTQKSEKSQTSVNPWEMRAFIRYTTKT